MCAISNTRVHGVKKIISSSDWLQSISVLLLDQGRCVNLMLHRHHVLRQHGVESRTEIIIIIVTVFHNTVGVVFEEELSQVLRMTITVGPLPLLRVEVVLLFAVLVLWRRLFFSVL